MNVSEPIKSLADPRAQRIADLAKPNHANTKTALIEDAEPLANALRAGVEFVEVYHDDAHPLSQGLAALCAELGVPVCTVEGAVLTKLFRSDKRPRVFGVAVVPRPDKLSAL
ncbi:MAG: NshR/TsnR family 23S rRNA methyltransferase, partial [Bifidobacteriaceae bacterium]|nr:NshR/TsnR family 23S rRNA methyltransferase [Bifidobacteriaceae bacterium]